jgi:hypothetical protein
MFFILLFELNILVAFLSTLTTCGVIVHGPPAAPAPLDSNSDVHWDTFLSEDVLPGRQLRFFTNSTLAPDVSNLTLAPDVSREVGELDWFLVNDQKFPNKVFYLLKVICLL